MTPILAALLLGLAAVSPGADPGPSDPAARIARMEREWADCFVQGVPGAAEEFIADDFVGVTSKGVRYEKARAIQDIRDSKGRYKSLVASDITVRVYGDAAVARGTDSWEMADGAKGAAIWTDTWIRRPGGWQIVAAQDTPK
ncbi:MAG TPA: nuclear transport factor 2 family protein [Thermoanaerobaculia bacterium]|jgi:hypothetical protein|nr:nuclear transport factor 2 family protein [Thermoanaerobaculia bacterium]